MTEHRCTDACRDALAMLEELNHLDAPTRPPSRWDLRKPPPSTDHEPLVAQVADEMPAWINQCREPLHALHPARAEWIREAEWQQLRRDTGEDWPLYAAELAAARSRTPDTCDGLELQRWETRYEELDRRQRDSSRRGKLWRLIGRLRRR